MAERQKKATLRKTQVTKTSIQVSMEQFAQLILVLNRIASALEKNDIIDDGFVYSLPEEQLKQPVFINQAGEVEEVSLKVVKEEAKKLVDIDKETTKRGFNKAKEILLANGIDRLETIPKEKYSFLISEFRKAVADLKTY